jgi:hypothetical protein
MARQNATNFAGGLQFPYATAGTDIFKKEDVQVLAQAVDQHDHSSGKGLVLPAGAIPNGLITSAMIADGTIVTADLAANAATRLWNVAASTANPSTTSTALVDMPDLNLSVTTVVANTIVLALLMATASNNAAGQGVNLAINVDGTDFGMYQMSLISANAWSILPYFLVTTLASVGAHTFKGRYGVNGSGTASLIGIQRQLIVLECRR